MPHKKQQKKVLAVMVKKPTIHRNLFKANLEKVTKIAMTTYFDVAQSSGFAASLGTSIYLEYPMCYYNGAFTIMPVVPTNFARMNAVYDEYQVESLRLRYHSFIPAEYAGDIATYYSGAAGVPVGYMEKDYDDAANIATEGQALNKSNPFSLLKGHSITMRNEKLRLKKWLNTSNINTRSVSTAVGTTLPDEFPKESSIKLYFPLIPNAVRNGRIYATWNIKYKSLRTV